MEVDATSEDVGAGQTTEGELGTVGAATDGFHLGSHAHCLHGVQHEVDDVHLGVNLLLHVVVLVAQLAADRSLAVALIHLHDGVLYQALALLEAVAVVVADDVRQRGVLHVRLQARQVEESLVALSGLRRLVLGQQSHELGCQQAGVHHLALGIARMHADTFNINLGRGGIEVLELQLAHVATVHGVGPLATEALHVEMVGTHAYLLVGVEGYAYVAVGNLLVLLQIDHGLHNLGYAGLVVSTQQRRAVGHDEVFAHVVQQLGKLAWRRDNALGEQNVLAVVLLDYLCLDAGTRAVGRRVVVGNETDGGHLVLDVRLQRGVDVTLVVHLDIAQSLSLQFLLQVFGKHQLLGRAGHALTVLSRLRVVLRIVDESFCNMHSFFWKKCHFGCKGTKKVLPLQAESPNSKNKSYVKAKEIHPFGE